MKLERQWVLKQHLIQAYQQNESKEWENKRIMFIMKRLLPYN